MATIARFWLTVNAEYCTCCCAVSLLASGSSFCADFSMSVVAISVFCAVIADSLFVSAMVLFNSCIVGDEYGNILKLQ